MRQLLSTFFLLLLSAALYAQEHSFEFIPNHIYLNAEVNGKTAHLVFDTGSADVYLDSTWLAESGVKYSQMGKAMVRGAGNETKPTVLIFSGVNISLEGKQYSPQMVPI
ncbi:MAG: aspartyl protease family protein, partial [Prevotella sp.]|nr:aspartyl protease family protein [Prevotella sp.]